MTETEVTLEQAIPLSLLQTTGNGRLIAIGVRRVNILALDQSE
jgi:hypothetical protein